MPRRRHPSASVSYTHLDVYKRQVLVGVDADAQPIHVVADLGAGIRVMLADAAGKDDGIHAAHSGNVAANGLFDLVVQHVAGQLCALVAVCGSLFPVSYTHLDVYKRQPQGSAVALGYFDGVHCGHRAVLGAAVDI